MLKEKETTQERIEPFTLALKGQPKMKELNHFYLETFQLLSSIIKQL